MSVHDEIDSLIKINEILSNVNNDKEDIRNLKEHVYSILYNTCYHDICEDMIDINDEKCQTIHYCNTCFLTLDIDQIYKYIIFSLKYVDKELWLLHYQNHYCKLLSVTIQNNKIVFSIILKEEVVTLEIPLKNLFRCKVVSNIVFLPC